jgi:hypothetical protein
MENEDLKLEELTREQILDLAGAQGRKLGFLLATSALDENVKTALLGILECATPEQINLLSDMLEEGYLAAENKQTEDFLRLELVKIKKEFDEKENNLEEEILNKLKAIEEKLD